MYKLLFINFIVMMAFNMAHPVTPELLILKESPAYLNGMLFAAMSVGIFVSSPKIGKHCDQHGVKKLLFIGPIGYGVCQLFFGFLTSSILLLIFRFFSGIFASCFVVAVTSSINHASDETNKTRNFGYILFVNGLSGIFGQMIGGAIGTSGGVFLFIPIALQLVIGTFGGLLVFIWIPNAKTSHNTIKTKSSLSASLKLGWEKKIIDILLVMSFMSISINLYTTNIGLYVTEKFNFDTMQVGVVNSYSSFIMMSMNLFAIKFLERYISHIKIVRNGSILALIAMVIAVFGGINQVIIPIGLFLIGTALFRPIIQRLVVHGNEKNAGELVGVAGSFNALGMILGSMLSGTLYAINTEYPFYAIVFFLAIAVTIILIRGHKYEF